MATLLLSKVWVNLVPTGDAVSAPSIDRTRSYEAKGEVRTYGSGRQRAVTAEGLTASFGFTLRLVTWTQIQTLVSWIGRTVLIRDNRGTAYFAVFMAVTPVEIPKNPTKFDAQLVVRQITTSGGV
jgi:hypothetical protein